MNNLSEPEDPGLFSQRNRPDLIGEHRLGDAGQLILLVLFLVIWVLDSFVLSYSTRMINIIPWYIRYPLAIAVMVFAGYLARSGLRTVFGEVKPEPQVYSTGVFSIVRHPIYLGSILTYLGFIFFTLSLASFLFWILIIIFYFYISRYEERLLLKHFGDQYREYQSRVPMLFPFKIRRG